MNHFFKPKLMNRFTVLMLFLTIGFSCKKDPEQNLDYCELHPEECVDIRMVKDWFYFDYGSWWVYEEENSGMRDSVYVIETWSDTGSHKFLTRVHSTYDGYDYPYFTQTALETYKNHQVKKEVQSTGVYRAKTKPGDFVAEDKCFLFYPKVGMWSFNYGDPFGDPDSLIIKTLYDNFELSGYSYQEVVGIYEITTAVEEYQPTMHFFAKGVGLIKKELLDSNQIWNLVDYHIN
jgi:hypothetical protein